VPVLAFVRQKILDLKPLWERDQSVNLSPTVEDNRVFELIKLVSDQAAGNWLFPFTDSQDIMRVLGFQLSGLLRSKLQAERLAVHELYFRYANQHNVLLRADGMCYRMVQYSLVNNTGEPLPSYVMGENSDRPIANSEFALVVTDASGSRLAFNYIINSPQQRRWEVIFDRPLPPRQALQFYTQYASFDVDGYIGQHTRHVEEGFISYVLPRALVGGAITADVRSNAGWRPVNDFVFASGDTRVASIPYGEVSGVSQFRIRWS
jgi:hypothetical protein